MRLWMHHWDRDRITSAFGVALLHLALGSALVAGLGVDLPENVASQLRVFDVREPPPPPIEEPPPPPAQKQAREEGAAAPSNLKARPTQVVAPVPEVKLEVPPPLPAALVPGPGAESSAGASDRPGPGTGAGGIGNGLGSGDSGSGTGSGGIAFEARLIKGRIRNSDYPDEAARVNAGGAVLVRFTVTPKGRASGCTVVQSSGRSDLDATTCRLIEQRFRYRPARDAAGNPVPQTLAWRQVWWLEGAREEGLLLPTYGRPTR